MANRSLLHGSSSSATPAKTPVLLLMDSPRKDDEDQLRAAWPTTEPTTSHGDETVTSPSDTKPSIVSSSVRRPSLTAEAQAGMMNILHLGRMGTPSSLSASSSDSLGRLLVEMTAQVQDERSKRSDVEKKNQSLMLEIEQLQKEVLELKTSKEQQSRRRASGDWDAATRPDHHPTSTPESGSESAGAAGNAEFWWQELQEAKSAKDKAQHDAHHRAMEVMELNACISMQHDELKALRASDADVRFALARAEERSSEMLQQHTVLVQESQLLRDEVAHLNHEIGKRGSHFKALMDKWSEAQAQSEHWERENRAMLDKMKELRTKHEQLQQELQTVRDDRDLLQHQANHLKGAVAAKAAESKAFQAYGTNARDHLQAQHAMIQRHQIYRRKVNHIARDSVSLLKHIKSTLVTVRAPLVTIQNDFRQFLKNLQTPVLALVTKSRHFAQVAHVEHAPLRVALLQAELSRRHLHDQLWRQRRNALLVCQIRNVAISTRVSATAQPSTTVNTILGMVDPLSCASSMPQSCSGGGSGRGQPPAPQELQQPQRALRANYATGELLLRETDRETLTVKCDAVFSDRTRGAGCWNNHECVAPLLQSMLDGFNACVATFDGLPPLKLDDGVSATSPAATETNNSTMGVPELILTQLFELLVANGPHFHRIKLTISFLGVFNEAIYDLLGLDPHGAVDNSSSTPSASTSNMNKIVVLEIQNVEEALLVLRGGVENLETAHELGVMDKFVTHKVITVCVAHENLLVPGNSPTKAKLQIVELATGPLESGDTSTSMGDWEDRSKVKAHVAMENGIQALLTTLADVRVAADSSGSSGSSSSYSSSSSSGGFVRYHSSKLTVLLQDTVKPSAKFLGIAALPGGVSSSSSSSSFSSSSCIATVSAQQPQLDTRSALATRWLYQLRQAVGTSAGASTSSHGVHDRSVEGFINRYTTHHADHNGGKGGAGGSAGGGGVGGSATSCLAFSSAELVERQTSAHGDPGQWEKEHDRMARRYGDLTAFTTTFYQPTPPSAERSGRNGWSSSHTESYSSRATSPRRQSACTVANADQLTDVVIRPHELVPVDASSRSSSGSSSAMAAMTVVSLLPPPPAPVKAKPRTASVKSRVLGHRNGTKARVHSTTAATMVGSSDAVTTLAPRRGMTMAATSTNGSSHKTAPMVQLRRETASSHLKKAIATQSSTTARQTSSQVFKTKSVPFK